MKLNSLVIAYGLVMICAAPGMADYKGPKWPLKIGNAKFKVIKDIIIPPHGEPELPTVCFQDGIQIDCDDVKYLQPYCVLNMKEYSRTYRVLRAPKNDSKAKRGQLAPKPREIALSGGFLAPAYFNNVELSTTRDEPTVKSIQCYRRSEDGKKYSEKAFPSRNDLIEATKDVLEFVPADPEEANLIREENDRGIDRTEEKKASGKKAAG